MKKRVERALIEMSLSTLQLLVSKAQAIFDLVDHVRDCKHERAKRCSIILCQCRPLLNSPAMQSVLIKLVADEEEAELAQVSLFLSEKISFRNSRLYDRETTLDILWSHERRGRLYYSGILEPSNIEGSEGLLSGYEGRAIGSRNRANSSESFLYLRPGGDSSFYWQTGQWKWPLSKPTLCTDPWSSLSEDVILRRRQSKWSWKGQDSRTVALPQKRRPTIQSRADEKPSWWNFQLVFPKTLQERPVTLPSYSSRTLYGGN